MRRISKLLVFIFIGIICSLNVTKSYSSISNEPVIYLRPNTTQVFTELYQKYGLIDNAPVNVIVDAVYLDQTGQPPILPLQPSNQSIFSHAETVLHEFHKSQKNIELFLAPTESDSFFYTSNGSIQIIFALVYAIAISEPDKKFLFVEKIPYYSGHENSVGKVMPYSNARFQGFHDVDEIKPETGEILVEFVTSPNNPDGKFRKPFTDASIIIGDFVFASSAFGKNGTGYLKENLEWIKKVRSEGKHFFSFNSASKQFGKTGNRCGYLWYPMSDVYAKSIFDNFFKYISSTTVAGNTTGLSNFLDLISAFLMLPDKGAQLRADGFKIITIRHEIIKKELIARYPSSIVISIAGSPTLFAQLKDSRIPESTAADIILKDTNTSINPGTITGEDMSFIRLNLTGYTDELVTFANRLAGFEKYVRDDLFFSSKAICSEKTIYSENDKGITYIAKPGDCLINADASKGPVTIMLPQFIGYRNISLTIKKIDDSENSIMILFDNTTKTLDKNGQTLKIKWNQSSFEEISSLH
jgi:aspartate/methionine/tyrosine aminotransferase